MRILLAAVLSLALPASAMAAVDAVPGELIVKLRHGRAHIRHVPLRTDLRRAARALERDPRIDWAQPNVYQRGAALPNDALYGQQWALPRIDAPAAWDITTGSDSVRVAIVDSGINFDEPDLTPNIAPDGWDFVQDDDDPSDNSGHGTHVAGIVAARGNNGMGVSGVAWRASLIPVRVLDNTNLGSCWQIAEGMAYAVRQGARVVNLSLGSPDPCQPERDVIDAAPNVLFVIAAMNDSEDVDVAGGYPCAFPSPNIICVAATDANDELAGFSNYGAQSVDLAAPGDDILSSFLKWGPKQVLYSDGFENPLTGTWATGGSPDTWGRSFTYWRSGAWSLSDSPSGQYANDTDNYAQLLAGLDLTGRRDCAASVYTRLALSDGDLLLSDTSPDGVHWGDRLGAVGGSTSGAFSRWLIDLSQLEGRAGGGLRFRLLADGSGTNEGVALDDLDVFCVPPITGFTGAPDEFAIDWGTSMAAPHVTGTAALLLALEPRLDAGLLKQVLLATADPLPSLAGKTVTGARLNAASALRLVVQAQQQAQQPQAPPEQAPGGGNPPPPAPDVSVSLAADLEAFAKSLAAGRIRSLLRRGRVTVRLHHQLPAGRFALTIADRHGRTIAKANGLTAKLTRRGRALLRHGRRVRLRITLTFRPQIGAPVVVREVVAVRR
jgi:subtilisin family serine protease